MKVNTILSMKHLYSSIVFHVSTAILAWGRKRTYHILVLSIHCLNILQVHTYIKSYIGKHWKKGRLAGYARKSSEVSATQFTSVASGRRGTKSFETDNTGYIPLSTSSTANESFGVPANHGQGNGHVTFAT